MFEQIVSRTKRVPVSMNSTVSSSNSGEATTRQFDVALMSVGWKLSPELYVYLSGQSPSVVKDTANRVLPIINKMIGNHVQHNVYFKNFPNNIPDTQEFWMGLVKDALDKVVSREVVAAELNSGVLNLLSLPSYGKYLHTYEDMVQNQEKFLPSLKDSMKLLHLGGSLQDETVKLYHQLAGSTVPLNEVDRKFIVELTELCLDESQPTKFPVRENKAVVNVVRLDNKRPVLADTVTDVLRLACAVSGGDVTLSTVTKFKSFPRRVRRVLLNSLSDVLTGNEYKLADVGRYSERWKRLGEKLHPHEAKNSLVNDVFAVARGDKKSGTHAAKVEIALAEGNLLDAIKIMETNPGYLFRSLDRISLLVQNNDSVLVRERLIEAVHKTVKKVSGRVIFSVWEHLLNATARPNRRIFQNTKGKIWTQTEDRKPVTKIIANEVINVLKQELGSRYAEMGIEQLVVDQDMLSVALPLSEKNKSSGFGILPKGSVVPVVTDTLRFFIHWKQKQKQNRTDYDLSAFFMNKDYTSAGHVSWTRLSDTSSDATVVHSGDITSAPNGASEFIDIKLNGLTHSYIVAQINRYAGEDFSQAEESFFGFMERDEKQKGLPFEPKTVKVKSEVRGKGQVAVPAVFFRNKNGWFCKWLDMQLTGQPICNTVEGNKATTSMMIKSIMERKNLTIKDLMDLLPGTQDESKMAYVGFQQPETLSKGITKVMTLDNLTGLIPQ